MADRREEEIVTRGDRERASNRLWRLIFWIVLILAMTYLAVSGENARADSLRCGNDLVRPGDSVLDVQDACGRPDREAAIIGEDNTRVGTAFYYRMEYKADRKVIFRGGSVARIERL